MKTNKIILTLSLLFVTVFGLAACDSQSDILSEVLAATNQLETVSVNYAEEDLEAKVSELANVETIYAVQTLSETTEEPVADEPNPFILFNELRSELIATHRSIVAEVETFKSIEDNIRSNIQILRDKEYDILEGDKELIRGYIEDIKALYDALMETNGQAYLVLSELEYTRENLEVVNETFAEVQEVLDSRLDIIQQGIVVINNIDALLADYMG